MQKSVNLEVHYHHNDRKDYKNNIKLLEELMDDVNGRLIVNDLGDRTNVLSLRFDLDDIKRRTHRRAGRPTATLCAHGTDIEIKLDELEDMIKQYGSDKTAKMLDISRATMYRKIAKAKESGSNIVK